MAQECKSDEDNESLRNLRKKIHISLHDSRR
jgi:hypothetical protein